MAGRNYTPFGFYVYLHCRTTDGKVFYVGKGKGNRAFTKHGRNKYWHRVVKNHGFFVKIVEHQMQEWWAFELERDLISLYGRSNLCNATDGGEGASGVIVADKTKNKLSVSSSSMWKNPEIREKIIKCMIDKSSMPHIKKLRSQQRKGVKKSESMIQKLKESKKGIVFTGKHIDSLRIAHRHEAHKVQCLSEKICFPSIMDAVRWVRETSNPKAQDGPIRKTCKNQYKSAYGFEWSYI